METKNKPGKKGKIVPFKKRGPLAVVDFDGMHVRVVQVTPNGETGRINRLGSAKLEARNGASLRKAFDELKIKTREVLFALPRSQVVLRPLQVPNVGDVRELAAVVNFQIARDLPFRVEDAVVDFKILRVIEAPRTEPEGKAPEADKGEPSRTEEKLELLVGAVKREIVQELQAIAKAAGLKVRGIALRSAGNARAAQISGPLLPGRALAVVAAANEETTIDIVAGSVLVFSRVAAGAPPPDAIDAYRNALSVEVVRSLHSYDGMMLHQPVTKVVVAGVDQGPIATLLRERLEFPIVEMDPAILATGEGVDRSEASAAFGAIGLALLAMERSGLTIDFANPKRPPVQRDLGRLKTLGAVAAAIVLLISLLAVRANLVKKRMAIRSAVQEQVTDAEKKVPIYKKLKAQAKAVSTWTSEEQNWLDHLAYLTGILPGADQIYVSAITTTPQHLIRFSVQARSGELLAELDKNLRAAGYEVKPLSITPANDKHGYNFRTTVELAIPKKMKIDLSKVKPPARPADDALKASRS